MHSIRNLTCNIVQNHAMDNMVQYSDEQLDNFIRENALSAIEDAFHDIQIQLNDVDVNHTVQLESLRVLPFPCPVYTALLRV